MKKLIALSGKQGSGKNEVANIIQFLTSMVKEEVSYKSSLAHFYSSLTDWKQHSFAYKVRESLSSITGLSMEILLDNNLKNKTIKELTGVSWEDNGVEMTIRKALQKFATDAIRYHFHKDTWAKGVQTDILNNKENNYIITDLRFKNEYKMANDMNAIIIRIFRYMTSQQWHKKFEDEVQVIDPDGWNRKNFKYSWFEERISQLEYEKRLMDSTCLFKVPAENLSFNHQSETELDNVDITDWHYLIDNDTDNIQDLINKTKRILEEENII